MFQYPGFGCYKQIRGLAAGSGLSGTLAILVMDRFEHNYIYRNLKQEPLVYVRYIDDTGKIVNDDNEARQVLRYLNEQHPTIKFELELPDESGFLPILDIKITINKDGSTPKKLCIKKANKGITLHNDSHHPTTTKRMMIRHELPRANKSSDESHREGSMDMVKRKLENNGYDKGMITQQPYKHRTKRPPPQFTFPMPYLSEEFNGRIRHLLKLHNIDAGIVNPTPMTIKQYASQKQKNVVTRTMRKCPMKSAKYTSCYVAYEGVYELCTSSFVGSTGRQVHTRCQEHLRAAMKHDLTSVFGRHYHQIISTALTEYYILHSATHCTRRVALEDIRSLVDKEATKKNQQEDGRYGNWLLSLVNS